MLTKLTVMGWWGGRSRFDALKLLGTGDFVDLRPMVWSQKRDYILFLIIAPTGHFRRAAGIHLVGFLAVLMSTFERF